MKYESTVYNPKIKRIKITKEEFIDAVLPDYDPYDYQKKWLDLLEDDALEKKKVRLTGKYKEKRYVP